MLGKRFLKIKDDKQPGFHIAVYSYVQKKDSATDRYNIVFGERDKLKLIDLEFVIWQKDDADKIVSQLLLKGFKKKIVKLPSLDSRESAGDFITYEKGSLQINYTEEDHDTGTGSMQLTYVFRLSNE